MGKMDPESERHFREMIEEDRPKITMMFPELAIRPAEMRKAVEAMDALIMSWIATRPESAEELKAFFDRQIAITLNFYSPYVCAEFRDLCGYLRRNFPNGTAKFTKIEVDGKMAEVESHLVDSVIVRRNMLAAYLGDELKCILDYLEPEEPETPAAPSAS